MRPSLGYLCRREEGLPRYLAILIAFRRHTTARSGVSPNARPPPNLVTSSNIFLQYQLGGLQEIPQLSQFLRQFAASTSDAIVLEASYILQASP